MGRLELIGLELLPKLSVDHPATTGLDMLSRRYRSRPPGERDQVLSPFDLDPQDGKAVLWVMVGDAFDESVQGFAHPRTISAEIVGRFRRLDMQPQFQRLAILGPADLEDRAVLAEMKMF